MRTLLTHIFSVLAFAGTPFVQSSAFSAPADGHYLYVATRKTVAQLTDEQNRPVMSEKTVEIHFRGGKPVRTGDQFGLSRVQR